MVSPGMTLGGRYRLDDRIAGGGMGDVWRGTDEVLGRTVAVKILLPALLEEPGFAERFRGEARTMATINHPGVVDIYDYGSEGDTAFLVMEYVEGDALSRTLSRVGRLTPARTMALVAQAADALQAAHEKGIVHRDVKPGNLLVRPNGTLVLTDFGIARSAMVGQLTMVGSVLGTAAYISPEQAEGATASPLSDVYALGVVTYQCLAGHRPFDGDSSVGIAMRHVRDAPPPLPNDIPPVVRQVVERAMAKNPSDRYPSAVAMAHAARRAAASVTGAGLAGVPAAPVSPTGTQVLPNAAYPSNGPVSPAPRTGQYARGAAMVPAAPLDDYDDYDDYDYAEPTGAARRAGGGAGTGGGRAGGAGGKNVAAWAILAVFIVVLFCLGGGYLLLHANRAGDNQTGAAPPTSSAGPTRGSPRPSAKPSRPRATASEPAAVARHNLVCEDAVNQDAVAVRKNLEDNNYPVKIITDQPGGRRGRVAVMSPCGSQAEGTEVTLRVFTGNNATTPDPQTSCNPFNPDNPTDCPTSR
ncbi:MAG: eukaryotic-like serine/threonine-protein kinase [Micromonosporaceae bacterium]|nr:eukaryotic-like serine/threonine-protein kinase [Micromonosporaceae bacterium]